MRFIFHNPDDIYWYKPPITYHLKKRKSAQKYTYLLDYFLENNRKVHVYIDRNKLSSHSYIRKVLAIYFWFYLWAIINKINPLKFNIITNSKKIRNDDIIFMFLWDNFTNLSGVVPKLRLELNDLIRKTDAFKVVHLTHYIYNANSGSLNTKNANIDLFVAENNLYRNNIFFRNTFNWCDKDVCILPFVPNEKFKNVKSFEERKNKVLATGTITFPMEDRVFESFFGHTLLQPMRNLIYEKKEDLRDYIDSIISPINENKNSDTKQEKYFSHDIVELYNNYKMFIVPEEVSGLPGIGFIEGMKCGSAFIGLNDPVYTDIGLKDKVHFIGYDGTLNDLISKIEYYQNHQDELEAIAKNGYHFVAENFNKHKTARKFINEIESIAQNRNQSNVFFQ